MTPHLYLSEVPNIAGRTETMCGFVIRNPQAVLMWESLVMGKRVDLENTRCCRRCLRIVASLQISDSGTRQYLFGLVEAGGADESEQ